MTICEQICNSTIGQSGQVAGIVGAVYAVFHVVGMVLIFLPWPKVKMIGQWMVTFPAQFTPNGPTRKKE